MSKTVIIIPSRLSAKRLPNKPLLKINDKPMIVQVYKRAVEANIGEVYVATPDQEIIDVINNFSGKSIITKNNHKTGSDRVYEAYNKIDDKNIDFIINLQGDMPNIDPKNILKLNNLMEENDSDIGTLGANIIDNQEIKDKNIVKVKTEENLNKKNFLKSEDFFRIGNTDDILNIYHHVGIYIFRPNSLKKYINLSRTKNEIERNLEQMRILDNNLDINVGLSSSVPLSVDTEEELEKVRQLMSLKK
jgi:3-deoxy-manno-octulosonate cytidylyltransferase (CMP-KDO synthetase)